MVIKNRINRENIGFYITHRNLGRSHRSQPGLYVLHIQTGEIYPGAAPGRDEGELYSAGGNYYRFNKCFEKNQHRFERCRKKLQGFSRNNY